MPLYHKDICLPCIAYPQGVFPLSYGEHALAAAQDDKYGSVTTLPTHLDTSKAKKIEVDIDCMNNLVKIVYRIHLDKTRDLVLAISVNVYPWKVRTVWIQPKSHDNTPKFPERYHAGMNTIKVS